MRTKLNDLEKMSDHRILCRTADEQTAVFKELAAQGYMWPSNRPLTRSYAAAAPKVLFTYKHGAPDRHGKKIVLQSSDEMGITPENRILTAAQWLNGFEYFNGINCTIPEETA